MVFTVWLREEILPPFCNPSAAVLSLANAFIFPAPLLLILWPLGLNGIWLNTPVASILVAIVAGFQLARVMKRDFPGTAG